MMADFLSLFLLTVMATSVLAAPELSKTIESCDRRGDAKIDLVYLHGLDTEPPSSQELGNRKLLKSLQKKLPLNLLILRSPKTCKTSRCWPQSSNAEINDTAGLIRESIKQCLSGSLPLVGLGFSNGGYFLGRLLQECPKDFSQMIAVGSAGGVKNKSDLPALQNRAQCPAIHFLIGKKDITFRHARTFHLALKAAGFRSTLQEFKGAHELPPIELEAVLKSFSGPN